MNQLDNASDRCEGLNPLLKRIDSCRSTESSTISFESDGRCYGQPTTGYCEPAPSLLARSNVCLINQGVSPHHRPTSIRECQVDNTFNPERETDRPRRDHPAARVPVGRAQKPAAPSEMFKSGGARPSEARV
jgi:hypothetical protein